MYTSTIVAALVGALASIAGIILSQLVSWKNETFRARALRLQKIDDRIIDSAVCLCTQDFNAKEYQTSIVTLKLLLRRADKKYDTLISILEQMPQSHTDLSARNRISEFEAMFNIYWNGEKIERLSN
jgi:hypothetical protein